MSVAYLQHGSGISLQVLWLRETKKAAVAALYLYGRVTLLEGSEFDAVSGRLI
jgi:hypothetical protein